MVTKENFTPDELRDMVNIHNKAVACLYFYDYCTCITQMSERVAKILIISFEQIVKTRVSLIYAQKLRYYFGIFD